MFAFCIFELPGILRNKPSNVFLGACVIASFAYTIQSLDLQRKAFWFIIAALSLLNQNHPLYSLDGGFTED